MQRVAQYQTQAGGDVVGVWDVASSSSLFLVSVRAAPATSFGPAPPRNTVLLATPTSLDFYHFDTLQKVPEVSSRLTLSCFVQSRDELFRISELSRLEF